MANLSGKYETLIPVTTEDGVKPVGETVELTHEDAEVFLARGFVKETESASPGKVVEPDEQDNTPDDDGAAELTVSEGAGREELIAAGYIADSDVRVASDKELLTLDGINKTKLEKIRDAVPITR